MNIHLIERLEKSQLSNKKFVYTKTTSAKEQSVSNSKYEIENRATNYNAFNAYAAITTKH